MSFGGIRFLRFPRNRSSSPSIRSSARAVRSAAGTAEGVLPGEVKPVPLQYGPSFLTFALYLRFVQFLPYERLSELCRALFGVPLAKGTTELWERLLYTNLEPFEEAVRRLLVETVVLCVDETGLRVAGLLHWPHVAATERATLLSVFKRRDKEGIDYLGVLLEYTGMLVHDC